MLKKILSSFVFLLVAGNANAQVVIQPQPTNLTNPVIVGQIKCADGTVSAPCYSWINDLNSGWYLIGNDNIGLSLNGIKQVDYSTTRVAFTAPIYLPDGNGVAPSAAFASETNTGLYRPGASTLGFIINGAEKFRLSGSNLIVRDSVVLSWGNSGLSSPDLIIARDTANTYAQRNGANAQEARWYNFISGGNSEYGYISWILNSNTFKIGTGNTGTGIQRNIRIDGAQIQLQVAGNIKATIDSTGILSPFQFTATQGTITASNPFITHTTTWNNAGVTFVDDFRNITDTASAAGSLLAQWQVGGSDVFTVRKDGVIGIIGSGRYSFASRSRIGSSASGLIELYDSAEANGIQLNIGATDGTLFVRTRAGADSAVIKANTATFAAYNFNGTSGKTGATCSAFTVGGCTTSPEPFEYINNFLAPMFNDNGFHIPTFSEWIALNQRVLALESQLAQLKGVK